MVPAAPIDVAHPFSANLPMPRRSASAFHLQNLKRPTPPFYHARGNSPHLWSLASRASSSCQRRQSVALQHARASHSRSSRLSACGCAIPNIHCLNCSEIKSYAPIPSAPPEQNLSRALIAIALCRCILNASSCNRGWMDDLLEGVVPEYGFDAVGQDVDLDALELAELADV